MKRAQFEIMGLAIVMVIISVGIFFILSLNLQEDLDDDPLDQFVKEQFAQNLIDSTMKTSIGGCPSRTVSDAIYWIFSDRNVPRNAPVGSECEILVARGVPGNDDMHEAFDFVNSRIELSIQEYQNQPYNLQIRYGCEADDISGINCEQKATYGQCNPQRDNTGRAGRQIISLLPYSTQRVDIILWLCES